MQRIRTLVLRHVSPTGTHHDWLLEDPADRGGKLVCFRVGLHSRCWKAGGKLHLTRLADHRRLYLHYEGRVSGGRGWVRRIDCGWAVVRLWRQGRILLDVAMHGFDGLIEVKRVSKEEGKGRKEKWKGRISAKVGSNRKGCGLI